MEEPTIKKITLEKTKTGVNLEFTLSNGKTHIHTDLSNVILHCENSRHFLNSWSSTCDHNIEKNNQIIESIIKIMDK
jgi:hypothetical protein